MNFFEQQERARRNSGRLVILLGLAVLSLIALTSLSLVLIWTFVGAGELFVRADYARLIATVAAVVIAVVLLGSFYKTAQLSRGGKVVAERLGGRLINLQPQGFAERRLLNVVEEMALASGTSVPPVYVLDESAINAFAAGLTPRDAVIGITRGAIETLNREELQGVIAHEFSHIFHGDMRLNTRLVAVLHGILLLGLIGQYLLRGVSRTGVRRSNSRDSGSGLAAIALSGIALIVIGYAGTFFGNMIKAAVSRQREFLADASAVQFTRNPGGIAGALKKIGGYGAGSQLQAGNAAEFSHMYFGQGVSLAMEGLFATHPPLRDRIRRIEPRWDGLFPVVLAGDQTDLQASQQDWTLAPETLGMAAAAVAYSKGAADASIAAIGAPEAGHLQQARETLRSLPDSLRQAAHSPVDAQVLMFGLLLDEDADKREQQLRKLGGQLDIAQAAALERHQPALLELPAELRLPLLELAIPALKSLPSAEQLLLRRSLALLILADQQVSLLEWSLLRIIERNLAPPRLRDASHHLSELVEEAELLLSALAHVGHSDRQQARLAFLEGANLLPGGAGIDMGAMPELKALDRAVARLSRIWPLEKPQLLKAMARCIGHDGRITATEAELMRAVADSLDCPMPPLLPAAQGMRG
jgi:Zn-dependent protease with chaperone function